MSTPPNVTKRRKDTLRLDSGVPEDVESSNDPVNMDPNANWGTEPNFNFNFNLSSPSNPHPTKETAKMHSGNKKEDKSKGAATVDFSTISLPGEKRKSKTPTISSSTIDQMTVKGTQQLKPPNVKHPSTPTIQTHGNSALNPKPNDVELNSNQRSTEKVKTGIPKAESTKPLAEHTSVSNVATNPEMQSNRKDENRKEFHLETPSQLLQLPKSPKVRNQKGDKKSMSPQLTNRTPTKIARIKKSNPVNLTATPIQKPGDESRAQGVLKTPGTFQKDPIESAMLRIKPSQLSSLSPKPSTQRKTPGSRNSNTSVSEGNLYGKGLKAVSGSKIRVKSSPRSKETKGSKDSLDSKASSKSRSQNGSGDALDSKSSSASKTSSNSRDSLNTQQVQSSKAGPNSKLRIGSKETHDPQTTTETRLKESHQSTEKVTDFKTVPGSKNCHDSKLHQTSKANFEPKIKPSSSSDSKPGNTKSTSAAIGQACVFNTDLHRGVSICPISSGSINTASSAVELSLNPKSQSDSSRSGQVQPDSDSTLNYLPSAVTASLSPGSRTGKSVLCTVTGSERENQKSPSSSPGNDKEAEYRKVTPQLYSFLP